MSGITFDTLKYVDRLEKAGVSREQAKAEAEALQEALGEAHDKAALTTKSDLKETELLIKRDIETAKFEMLKWMVGLLLAQTGIIAALVKLL